MITGLVGGRIHRTPTVRTSQNGKRFVTTVLRAATRGGDGIFISVIAFSDSACTHLAALKEGDSAALAGELTPKLYHPKDGSEPRATLDLVAHAVMSEYAVVRKRRAVTGERDERHGDASGSEERSDRAPSDAPEAAPPEDLNDAIPF